MYGGIYIDVKRDKRLNRRKEMPVVFNFKHIDLQEIDERLNPNRPTSARGKRYISTELGEADYGLVCTAHILRDLWTANALGEFRIHDLENHNSMKNNNFARGRFPASLKRLARMKQVILDFDRDGVIIRRGANWIEI